MQAPPAAPSDLAPARACSRRLALAGLAGWAATWPAQAATAASAAVLRVGPAQTVRSLAEAARQARDGMLIEVEAGDYVGDVAVWPQHDLTLRAVGGRVRLLAAGRSAQGKALFVTTGRRQRIEGFDFIGAAVPDRNGAGIRFERGSLALRDCRFLDNEMGLLSSNAPDARLEIEDCEFSAAPSQGDLHHLLYVGRIAALRVSGSYFHHGQFGHLLKSRAAVNQIFYNRLSDGRDGRASYELEFPEGGLALVVGNLIEQSATTENPVMLAFGAEGYRWPRQALQLINNTWIDRRPRGGQYLRVAPGPVRVRALNNLLSGSPRFAAAGDWELRNNFLVELGEFVDAARGDYALRPGSPLRGRAVDPGMADGFGLLPTRQYRLPRGTLGLTAPASHPGALQQTLDASTDAAR